jgi:hypothetical protein
MLDLGCPQLHSDKRALCFVVHFSLSTRTVSASEGISYDSLTRFHRMLLPEPYVSGALEMLGRSEIVYY